MWWVCGVIPLLATLWSCSAIRTSRRTSDSVLPQDMDMACPEKCGDVFKRLDDHGVQKTRVQIRGEPKSGTTTSEEWATAALHVTCEYLKRLYGDDSCSMSTNENRYHTEMVFEPGLASASSSACSCTDVKRVTVSVGGGEKHNLPVNRECAYWHIGNVATSSEGMCQYEDGRPLENQVDLWKCVEEAACSINHGDALQLVVMRDPVPMAVSTYFLLQRVPTNHVTDGLTLDQFFLEHFELLYVSDLLGATTRNGLKNFGNVAHRRVGAGSVDDVVTGLSSSGLAGCIEERGVS
eukprot:g6154.t1